jgi:quinol monooxygenase YgiN
VASILAHISIKPGHELAFEAAAGELWTKTHALETGVHRYEYWRSETPNQWYALLSYEHELDFLHHQVSDHHEDASALFAPMFASVRLEWIDPVPGANHAPAGVIDPLPEDASALLATAKRRYAAQVAQWWGLIAHG